MIRIVLRYEEILVKGIFGSVRNSESPGQLSAEICKRIPVGGILREISEILTELKILVTWMSIRRISVRAELIGRSGL